MAITPKSLWGEAIVSTTAAAIYTSPANTTTVISRGVITNIGAAGAQLTLWRVPSGGARADGNIIVGASAAGQTVSAGPSEPYVPSALAGLTLGPGESLHAKSDTANVLNTNGSGWTQ